MAAFIEVNPVANNTGKPFIVNIINIVYVQKTDTGATIHLVTNNTLQVTDTYDSIIAILNP